MADLVLQASDDLVARLAHERDAVRAVVELVWNAIDAETTVVGVELQLPSVRPSALSNPLNARSAMTEPRWVAHHS